MIFRSKGVDLSKYSRNLNLISFSNVNLVKIDMPCCEITDICLKGINQFPSKLRILNLNYNPLGEEGERELLRLLKPLQNLENLYVSHCDLDGQSEFNKESLRVLDMSNNRLDGTGAIRFVQQNLVSLNLFQSPNENLIDRIFMKCSSLEFLKILELGSCCINHSDIRKIITQAPHLTRLNVSRNPELNFGTLAMILESLNFLEYLDFSRCMLIKEKPVSNFVLKNPEKFTLLMTLDHKIVNFWKQLWGQGSVVKTLPENIVLFKGESYFN